MKNNKQFNLWIRRGGSGRRGVALLIVLGLLGLLLISATAFAVLMRTERSAATNYRHTSSARHLLFTALNRAIEEIDTSVENDLNPDWPAGDVVVGTGSRKRTLKAPEGVLYSYFDDSQVDDNAVPARILTKDVLTYIPARYHRKLTSTVYAPPEWLPIRYGDWVVGRYAFAVIDTSGMLDASMVGDPNYARWNGASMREVRLNKDLLSVKDLIDVNSFTNSRTSHGRYETVAELASLNTGIDAEKLSNFDVFSYYSTNAPAASQKVNLFDLSAKLGDSKFQKALEKAFLNAGISIYKSIPLSETHTIWSNLLLPGLYDFIDEDSVMYGSFDRPCTEQLPLVASFGVRMTKYKCVPIIEATDTTPAQYQHTLNNEVFINIVGWPVVGSKATDGPYEVRGAVSIYNEHVPDSAGNDPADGSPSFDYAISPTGKKYYILPNGHDYFNSNSDVYEQDILFFSKEYTSELTPSAQPAQIEFVMKVAVEVYNKNNEMCYQFPGDKPPNQFKNGYPADDDWDAFQLWAQLTVNANFNGKEEEHFWAECVDPRFAFNYYGDKGRPPQWYANRSGCGLEKALSDIGGYTVPTRRDEGATGSLWFRLLSDPSMAAKVHLEKENIDGFHDKRLARDGKEFDAPEEQIRMCVLNGPITTPGELGYLLLGPWETIKLYDHWPEANGSLRVDGYHKVLDYFEVQDPNEAPLGKVNINTASDDVLSLIFLDMPLRSELSRSFTSGRLVRLTEDKHPDGLGRKLRTELEKKVASTKKPIELLSDLAYMYAGLPTTVGSYNKDDPNPIQILASSCDTATQGRKYVGEFEREALIRNVCNLFTVNQQLFTIVLRADAFTTRFGSDKLSDGTVLSSSTAVAQVFRDPVESEQGGVKHHDVTVRMVKILE